MLNHRNIYANRFRYNRTDIPITFISGKENQYFLKESTEKTYNLLKEKNGKELYKRYVIPNYGHIDCIFGKNAVDYVLPIIEIHLSESDMKFGK